MPISLSATGIGVGTGDYKSARHGHRSSSSLEELVRKVEFTWDHKSSKSKKGLSLAFKGNLAWNRFVNGGISLVKPLLESGGCTLKPFLL